MRFTDDNLGRLKINPGVLYPGQTKPIVLIDRAILKSLLARLEAETNAADLLQLHYESGVFDDLDEGDVALIIQALEARRKACGRDK